MQAEETIDISQTGARKMIDCALIAIARNK
ncbi:hypothetical protein K788_00038375 [Paraburkholderia caribensis MBA4]|uniref:Uncharacterized protein n=1 Tax=Paraburkholderia caribensis MBA4 TaxID=1323664 RepID=A0A0P0RGI5_9BURK|nr:hypothetical protein K788_00038375 [Paraburkholderia caribensis MBA4]